MKKSTWILLIIVSIILLILVFAWGNSNGQNKFSNLNESLTAREQAVIIKEANINQTQKDLDLCNGKLTNSTTALDECNKSLNEPHIFKIVGFPLSYSYRDIKFLFNVITIFSLFGGLVIPITFTLVKIRAKVKVKISTPLAWFIAIILLAILFFIIYVGIR